MDKAFEASGIWFLPDKADRTVVGALRFAPDSGIELDLVGSLRGDLASFNQSFQAPIVLGVLTTGQRVTLLNCFETASNVSFASGSGTFMTSKVYAQFAFRGIHFSSEADVIFDHWMVRLQLLEEWVWVSPFQVAFAEKPNSITYEAPEPIPGLESEHYDVTINFSSTLFGLGMVTKRVGFEQEAYFDIRAKTDKGLRSYLHATSLLANFISLCVGRAVTLTAITAARRARDDETVEDQSHQPPIEVFYQLPRSAPEAGKLLPVEMLVTLPSVRDRLPSLLAQWFKNFELLEPVYDLYFGTLGNPHMFLDQRFLALVQALESYHRRRFGVPPSVDHAERVARILALVAEADRGWLDEKLKYSHEPSLRKRLKQLLELHTNAVRAFIKNRGRFIERVVVTRNYLTHYDTSLEDRAAKTEDLYYLTEQVRGLLVACLLREAGFAEEEIEAALSGASRLARELAFAASKSPADSECLSEPAMLAPVAAPLAAGGGVIEAGSGRAARSGRRRKFRIEFPSRIGRIRGRPNTPP